MSPPEIKQTPDDLPPDEYHGHPVATPPARPDPPRTEAARLTRELAETYRSPPVDDEPPAWWVVLGFVGIVAAGAVALWVVGRLAGFGYTP
jgi:hypothetical protein